MKKRIIALLMSVISVFAFCFTAMAEGTVPAAEAEGDSTIPIFLIVIIGICIIAAIVATIISICAAGVVASKKGDEVQD